MNRRLAAYGHLAPLILRIGVGLVFFFAGLGKIMGGVDGVANYFDSLGIPLPGLMAPLVSYLELLGGLALIVGALTRVVALLLVGDMLVAILVAKLPGALAKPDFAAGFGEFRLELLLLLASAALALLGAGAFSVDAALLGDREPALDRRAERPALR